MDAGYTARASAVAAFSMVVSWTNHLLIVTMAAMETEEEISDSQSEYL